MTTKHNPLSSRRGSAVVTTIVITGALAMIAAGLISNSLTERRINQRHALRLEAKNASEAVVEYAFAQLRDKFEKRTNVLENALAPGSVDALILPDQSLLGSNIDWDKTEIVGGTVSDYPDQLTYIDPNDDNNEGDPLKGQNVLQRDIAMFAKTTVKDPRGGAPMVSRVTQKLQVRDAFLFSHAVFYNLDLEISPGPKMEIFGPVHANGNLYVQGISGVDFHSTVRTAGHFYHGWATTKGSAKGAGNEALQTGDVKFKNRDGTLVSMKVGSAFQDSKIADWADYADQRWHGNLKDTDHSIQNYTPVAFSEYRPDNPSTPAIYDPVNSGRDVIEPKLPDTDPSYKLEIENQKLAKKAGLRFVWDATTNTIRAYNKNDVELDISALEGSDATKLWKTTPNAMYDHRRQKDITMADINVGKLKQLIEAPTAASDQHIGGYDPAVDWNGIVYFETKSGTNSPRLNYSGVRLWGGETDKTGQGIPSLNAVNKDPGMTFATNNALYVKGHFNADGTIHNTAHANNSARVPEANEVPVALFGDSVTILSSGWTDVSLASKGGDLSKVPLKPAAQNASKSGNETLEIAAAIVSGLIPTDAFGNGRSSGGLHNFPRFLEAWGSDVYIRGSIVCLYESEVDNSPWRIDYYGPPGRKWGFSNLFKQGIFPPGTPLVRTYRRADFRELSEAEYQQAMDSLPW